MKRKSCAAIATRGGAALRASERGAALLSMLLMLGLIMAVTLGLMAVVQADLAAGIRQQQAMQVFNIAEAGMHHAIANLQVSGGNTYTGGTVSISDGGAPLGTAVVAVRCLNGTSPASACAGADPARRRITSTGTLTVGGPTRVISAVVEGTTSATSSYAICGYEGINFDQGIRVYGDVGTNGNLTLARGGNPVRICNSTPGGAAGGCTGPSPVPSLPYPGSAFAVGTITCAGGACNSTQIEGTIAPNQPAGSICPVVTLSPPSAPSLDPANNLSVPEATTIYVDPSINYNAVDLASSPGATCPADVNDRATLVIDSGADPNATVTVRMRTLHVGKCARLVIVGSGRVALWLLEPSLQALMAEQLSIFGSTSLGATPAAIPGGRFTINVTSTAAAAAHFNQSGLISGTFVVPAGGFTLNQAQLTNGALLARTIQFDRNTTFNYDPTSSLSGGTYSNFNRLRAWKDQ